MKNETTAIIVLLLVGQSLGLSLGRHDQALAEFCWRDSYGRGAGTTPTTCGNLDKIGLLCYPPCPDGYSRSGSDCHQNCPSASGWADQGLFCRLVEYGRGVGYPWKFGDGFNDNGMRARCEADNGQGNCEINKWIYYPKCKPGFQFFGCCICRPAAPDCNALGFNGGVDLSCAKKIIIGAPQSMGCDNGLEYNAGLCYPPCKSGFYGVGPVCWGNAPANWVDCGMGAATTTKVCVDKNLNQVISVGTLALNIATFGLAKAAVSVNSAAKAAEIKQQFETLKKLVESNKPKVAEAISKRQGLFPGNTIDDILKADPSKVTTQEMVRLAAQIASMVDPSAITDVVAEYVYPKCSAIKS